jgi:UDP-glucose 4-epimerase
MASKRVLVTGASGFVGRPLAVALARSGHAVRAAVRRPISLPEPVEVAIVPDFMQPVDWNPILRGVDIVVHAAGLAHVEYADDDGVVDRINRVTTQELARAAASAGVERFVYISSVRAQAGPSAAHVVSERDEPHPTELYGRSKLAAELAVRAAGVPFTILRPVVIYGPHAKGNMRTLARLAALPLPLPLAGLKNRRSLLALDNLVSVILFALNHPTTIGETCLVADPTPVSLPDVVAILRRAQGRHPRLVHVPPVLLRLALISLNRKALWQRLGEELIVDTGKLASLGWRPVVDTAEALVAMLPADRADASRRQLA